MKNGIERRRHLRVPLDLQVVLKTPQGVVKGKTADISVSGLAVILFLEKPEIGNEFEITLKSSQGHDMSVTSYSQMLCMALGGDPIFNDSVNELYFSDYISKPLRMM
mgnify:CR=1 FL=1